MQSVIMYRLFLVHQAVWTLWEGVNTEQDKGTCSIAVARGLDW